MNIHATGTGLLFQIVMEIDGLPDAEELRRSLVRFLEQFPVVNGRPARDYNLAPFWKAPPRAWKDAPQLSVFDIKDSANVLGALENGVNTPFDDVRRHLAFRLVRGNNKCFFTATFDHRLFDARGAEVFLALFQQTWEGKGDAVGNRSPIGPAHLSRWREKFVAGRQVNRAFLSLADSAPPRVLPLTDQVKKGRFRFKIITFNREASNAIAENANKQAGYLMLMPFALACTVHSMGVIFSNKGLHTGDYIIPVSIDMRSTKEINQDIFFNHESFLLFRVQSSLLDRFPQLIQSIKQQLYEQIKSGLPGAIREASLLMRIVPLPILKNLMGIYLKGQIASFCFSYLGETGYPHDRFMDRKVRNLFHMPRVPLPPGLGVFFDRSQGRLNVYISYVQGLLSDNELRVLEDTLKSRLEA